MAGIEGEVEARAAGVAEIVPTKTTGAKEAPATNFQDGYHLARRPQQRRVTKIHKHIYR